MDPVPRSDRKRLICCADGTWLASNIGSHAIPSNVAKIARAINPEGLDDQGRIIPQVVQYQSGLGSGDLPLQKAIFGGMGIGLDTDICQMYDFLANNYLPGDELFFFGFSRGAYTVRSVAGLVCDVGILSAIQMHHFPKLWDEYRKNDNGQSFKESVWYKNNQEKLGSHDVTIKVVGVWETVGALGIPEWPLVKGLASYGLNLNWSHAFHNTKLSKNIDYAFQALALDEKRLTFPPTIWQRNGNNHTRLEQCWFPGTHQNVGGQGEFWHPLGDDEEIGDHAFAWMVDNVSGLLTFTDSAIDTIIEHHRKALNKIALHNGIGCGRIVDNFFGIDGAFFRLLGQQDRTPGGYGEHTAETFHPIVRVRQRKLLNWQPGSMYNFELLEPDGNGCGWRWQKKATEIVPEWTMSRDKIMSVKTPQGFTTKDSLSRSLCPDEILLDLDRGH